MRVRTNLLLWATAVVFMLGVGTPPEVADAAQDSAGRTQRVPADETFAPIAIEELEPCCQSIRSERSDGQTGRTRRRVEVPRGEPVDPAAYRRLKEEAEFDPRAPRGSEVGLAEEALMLPAAPRMRSKFEGLDMKTAGNAALAARGESPN